MQNQRPDPDALLAAMQKEETARQRGQLKIFFGMSAGVGKTYAMLDAAQQRLSDGVDVVIGYVETHGRAETEALAQALPLTSRKKVEYRSVTLEEMDLDAILARRPQLVLVDELAHTNAPGSRHPKRYQDVLELLEAGIDVYTTVNVQHLESRADTVRQITGAPVRETVPDSIVEAADEIELIDLAPEELLKRLSEGKVYTGERADLAARHFFRKGNLTALREMALRLTAERVDHQLQDYMTIKRIAGPWKSGERMMVAVSPSPLSERLVRWTRRMAYNLGAPWIALHIETPRPLGSEQEARLAQNLSLAQELGAEVVTTADEDVVRGLLRVAHERNVTQIVVGKPPRSYWQELLGGHLLNRLVRDSGEIDIYVVTGDKTDRDVRLSPARADILSGLNRYLIAGLVILFVTGFNWLALPFIGYRAVSIVYLFAVSILAMFVGRGPAVLAAGLSGILWDFLFIPPQFTLTISALEDVLTLLMYFIIALVTGHLTARISGQEKALRRREQHVIALYALGREIASARTMDEVLQIAVNQIGQAFDSKIAVLIAQTPGHLSPKPHPASTFTLNEKEFGVATWAFENHKQAGRFTDTLPSAEAQYIPLVAPGGVVGVLAVRGHGIGRPTLDQQTMLEALARQVALVVERTMLDEAAQRTRVLAESERLYKTLLNSVSHELRTPLATITGAATSLLDPNIGNNPKARTELTDGILEAARRLNHVVENLLGMTRLESGRLKLNVEWCDVNDLISIALGRSRGILAQHEVIVEVPSDLPLVQMDLGLMEQALYNLLHNAAVHTPPGTRVRVTAKVEGPDLLLMVADRGPGLPAGDLERVFEKFYRAPGAPAGGTGLGLSITRGLVEAHGGKITAENRANGGVRFVIRLPLGTLPAMPERDTA